MRKSCFFEGKKKVLGDLLLGVVVLLFLMPDWAAAQKEVKVLTGWHHHKGASFSLYEQLTGIACGQLAQREAETGRLQSLGDWQQRQLTIRETLEEIVGPFPEKTALNARVMRTIKKEGYQVEQIVFESQPRFYVTASLYLPAGLKQQAPAVIYCSGHNATGYRSEVYQRVILNLVKKRFVVLAFDPVGQGERLEYYDPATGQSTVGGPTKEHSVAGAQAFIAGSSQARYMIWDGIRAVDYLLTRKEVDPARIGITGRSGGGTQSAYIAALDERIYAAAPECYITNFKRLLQSIGPQDAEQNLFHGIARGIDHPDFLAVRAPKPALVITTTNDFFSLQGARETARQVERIYAAYGQSGNFSQTEDYGGHESTRKNREAMYAFFQQHLQNPGYAGEEEVLLLTPEELRVTATGQVATALQSETVFSLNRQESAKWQEKLQEGRKNPDTHLPAALRSARQLSGYQEPPEPEEPVFAGNIKGEGYMVEKYFVAGEGGCGLPYWLYVPEKPNRKALVFIHPAGKQADSSRLVLLRRLAEAGYTVLAPDLPGTGETQPAGYSGDSFIGGVWYNLWYASVLTGRSLAGIRAGDLVRLVRLLERNPGIAEIAAVAEGSMSPVLLHAAAFYPSISRVALISPLVSYHSVVDSRDYAPEFIPNCVAGALKGYDLTDLAATLAPRPLLMIDVKDGTNQVAGQPQLDRELAVVKTSYRLKGVESRLQVLHADREKQLEQFVFDWLRRE